MRNALVFALQLMLLAVGGAAQMAPRDTASTMLDGHELAIEYGQPALNGRDIMALVAQLPADRMWRAGSEQVTTLTTASPVKVGGQRVAAGRYSVYVHCGEDGAFSFVLNSKVGIPLGEIWAQAPPELLEEPWPHSNYSRDIADSEVVRVPMKKLQAGSRHDRLKFSFQKRGGTTLLTMSWGDQSWGVPVAPGN